MDDRALHLRLLLGKRHEALFKRKGAGPDKRYAGVLLLDRTDRILADEGVVVGIPPELPAGRIKRDRRAILEGVGNDQVVGNYDNPLVFDEFDECLCGRAVVDDDDVAILDELRGGTSDSSLFVRMVLSSIVNGKDAVCGSLCDRSSTHAIQEPHVLHFDQVLPNCFFRYAQFLAQWTYAHTAVFLQLVANQLHSFDQHSLLLVSRFMEETDF